MKSTKQAISECYRRAAEILDERGWTQGRLFNPQGTELCALGALMRAFEEKKIQCVLDVYRRHEIEDAVASEYKDNNGIKTSCYGMITFNDTQGRTKEEVQEYLNEVAKMVAA